GARTVMGVRVMARFAQGDFVGADNSALAEALHQPARRVECDNGIEGRIGACRTAGAGCATSVNSPNSFTVSAGRYTGCRTPFASFRQLAPMLAGAKWVRQIVACAEKRNGRPCNRILHRVRPRACLGTLPSST